MGVISVFPGLFTQKPAPAALPSSTVPVFSGISGGTPNTDGSITASWSAGSADNPPIQYQVYIALGSVSAAALFTGSNLQKIVPAGQTSTRIFMLADQSTYLVAGQVYTLGVRARDAYGNTETNTAVITVTAVASGNLPAVFQSLATAIAATEAQLAQDHTNLSADHANFQADHANFQSDHTDFVTISTILGGQLTAFGNQLSTLAGQITTLGGIVPSASSLAASATSLATTATAMATTETALASDVTAFNTGLGMFADDLTALQDHLTTLAATDTSLAATATTLATEIADLQVIVGDLQAKLAGVDPNAITAIIEQDELVGSSSEN